MLLTFTACNNDEYNPPTFPDDTTPTVWIEGADSLDTGIFTALYPESQTFNLLVDATQSLFPNVSEADLSVEISDDTNFTFGYTQGESFFTVIPKENNTTSASRTASVTASIDDIYGGNTYTIEIAQEAADIPHFSSQPSNITFAQNFSLGDKASTSFTIDPASETEIDLDDISATESQYYIATIVDNGNYNYTITFETTMDAVNQISLVDDSIVVECQLTLSYYSLTETSDLFNVTFTK